MNEEFRFMTVKEFSLKMKIHPRIARRWIKDGKVKAYNSGSEKRMIWRIPYSEIQRIHAEAYLKKEKK